MAEEEAYDGIAIADLRVDSITWTAEQADHVRTRSSRYPGAVDLEAEWATEAALDPQRRFGLDPASKTGEAIRVVGRSTAAGRVLTVILVPEDHPPSGAWLGVTAWVTKGRDLRDYEAQQSRDDPGRQQGGEVDEREHS